MSRLWRAVAATLIAGVMAVFLTAGAAVAGPRVDDPCLNNPSVLCDPPNPANSELLPVNRWADATGGMHGRLETFDFPEKVQRYGTYPVLMSMGNSMWSGATSMTSAAIRMDILDTAGQAADNAAGKLGSSLMSSGILALVAVVALMVPMWRAARGQGGAPWSQLGKVGAIVGLFALMVTGASASTTSADGQFQPGAFSPGWWVVTTNNVIAQVASAPAAALVVGDVGAGYSYSDGSTGELSCKQYTDYLKGRYQSAHPGNRMESSVPLVMSGMWEATGLQVWSTSQFGADNPYGDFAYCRLLEQFAGTPAAEQRSITLAASGDPVAEPGVSNLKSLAWETAENVQRDRTMVAWAVCRPNGSGGWTVAPGWGSLKGTYRDSAGQVAGDCQEWWGNAAAFHSDAGTTFDDEDSAFEFKSPDVIFNDVPDTRARNYLLTLQGHTGGGVTSSLAMVYAYVFSSLVMLVVFGIIALAIILAKVASLVMMIAVFFALLMALWPNGNKGGIGKYLGQYVGMALFVFGIQLIFAFMTLLTSMMVQAGADMFGGSHFITMIWTGFAPVISVIVIHMVFTKFLKLPSPFSVTGAQQWGSAAAGGAVGGAIGAGLSSRVQRMRMRSAYALKRQGERAGQRALGAVTGGKLGRGRGFGRKGALVAGSAAAGAGVGAAAGGNAAFRPGRRGAPAAAPALDGGAPEVTAKPGFLQSRIDPELKAQRKQARDAAQEAAAARPKGAVQFAGRTVRTPYREGLHARLDGVRSQFEGKTVRQGLGLMTNKARTSIAANLPADGAAKTAGKVAGAAALTVATGGMALPVMGAVWAAKRIPGAVRGHVVANREAQRRAVDTFEAKRAAQELAAAKQAPAGAPVGAGAAHATAARRSNGESVAVGVPVRRSYRDMGLPGAVAGGGPVAGTAELPSTAPWEDVTVTAPVPATRAVPRVQVGAEPALTRRSVQGQPPRRGEKPFGRR